ncbi:MAG: organomercurial lyase [Rhodospirillales bacterium]
MDIAEPIEKSISVFEVRPGVTFPDLTVVRTPVARAALADIIKAFGIEKCFANYDADQDRVRNSVLRSLAERGRAPEIGELAEDLELPSDTVADHLSALRKKDLVVFDTAQGRLVGAYPLTERQTEHRIEIGGQQIHAMCAIDALGTGAMFRQDIRITSSCRASGAPITIETADAGTRIKSADPDSAIVWSGIQVSDGVAADSLCTVLAFFSSAQIFEEWRAGEHPHTPGYRLSLAEGIEVGGAIFKPFLAGIGPGA